MSLRKLPEIRAFQDIPGVSWEPPTDVMAEFAPDLRAAGDDSEDTITIYGLIGEDPFVSGPQNTSKRVSAALRAIGNKDVTVSVNSPGGSFIEGVGIYNLLRNHPGKVTVKVIGQAASAGSLIAMAGDEIQIAKAGFMLIHKAWVYAAGNVDVLAEVIETLKPIDEMMAEVYADRSGQKIATIRELMAENKGDGRRITGKEAIALGLADEFLPADQIDDAKAQGPEAAYKRLDLILARSGVSRTERRTLLKEITGTPSAAADATPRAGNDDLSKALHGLLESLKS
jgi:ATP-dependent Clp protease protease subunit